MLKDEYLINKFKRTADGILFDAFPFFTGFFFTACCSIHLLSMSLSIRDKPLT